MNYCFFKQNWIQEAHVYTSRHINLEGIFTHPSVICVSADIHGDFQLLYTKLVDVARVIRPICQDLNGRCNCEFQRSQSQQQKVNSPDHLLTLTNALPSCCFEWVAPPNTWVIVLGDYTDRCRENTLTFPTREQQQNIHASTHDGEMVNEESAILDFLNYCSVVAFASGNGGRVFKLIGNHELMNLDPLFDNRDYVTDQAVQDTGGKDGFKGRKKAFAFGGFMRNKLTLCGCWAIIQVGKAFFMHGGLSEQFTKHPAFSELFTPLHVILDQANSDSSFLHQNSAHSTIPQINAALWQWLHTPLTTFQKDHLQKKYITTLFSDPHTVFWERGLAEENTPPPTRAEMAEIFLQSIRSNVDLQGKDQIVVMGHCVQTRRYLSNDSVPTYRFFECEECDHRWRLTSECIFSKNYSQQNTQLNNQSDSFLSYPWCGIQFQITTANNGENNGARQTPHTRLYLCDCAESRAFDTVDDIESRNKLEQMELTYRAPQMLVFYCDENWRTEVLISKFHLPRRWLENNEIRLLKSL